MMSTYVSPDRKIRKTVLVVGEGCFKPSENCFCTFTISESNVDLDKYKSYGYSVGDSGDVFERYLDVLLQTMLTSEVAKVTFFTGDSKVEFTIELESFSRAGFIYEWDPTYKYNLAMQHKVAGNDLFKSGCFKDASYRFRKGLKILLSIPLDVENPKLQEQSMEDVYSLMVNFYNNLAACNLKAKDYDRVVGLCDKVLCFEDGNVKAAYKMGVACFELHNYERALEMFSKVAIAEPNNKAVVQNINKTQSRIVESNSKYECLVKRMFK